MRIVLIGDSHLARVRRDLARLGEEVVNAAVGGAVSGDLAGQADGVGIGPDDVVVVSIGTNYAAPWPKRCVDRALRQTAVSWTRRSWWRPSRWCATVTS